MLLFSLKDLANQLDLKYTGDANVIIKGIATLTSANKNDISFVTDKKHALQLDSCNASAVVISKSLLHHWNKAALISDNPYVTYAKLAQIFDTTPKPSIGVATTSIISNTAKVEKSASIGHYSVIEDGAIIGANVSIGSGCFIGKNVRIGCNTNIYSNVSIYHDVIIGENCLIHSSTVIGADGFGYAKENKKWIKIPQLGIVKIGNFVEIGASTTIDRGALDNTIIEDGVIIDNQCQIAHNVTIGENTAIAGCSTIAGSTLIGSNCLIGGACVINGHIKISDNVVITGMAMVMRSISEPGIYSSGIPLQKNKEWRKTASLVLNIDKMNSRIRFLEKNKM